jgi:anti-sigma B factor antagonist
VAFSTDRLVARLGTLRTSAPGRLATRSALREDRLTSRDTGHESVGLTVVRLPADPAPVLVVSGELDVYEAPAFRNELFDVIDEGHERVVVDCSGMAFIDSAGLATLVEAQRRLAACSGELVLRGVRPATRRIFEITDLVTLFSFEGAVS